VTTGPTIGVLALQGDVREHLAALRSLGADPLSVRRPAELAACDGLVIPGGESTTMVKLARIFDLLEPLREAVRGGLPAFGTCAGMIMLADRIEDGAVGQETIGGLHITVRRNAFGRQVDSFEEDLHVEGLADPVRAVFIRAPWVEAVARGELGGTAYGDRVRAQRPQDGEVLAHVALQREHADARRPHHPRVA
jgi:5'-phosphate synthase pdxT subunit